MRNDTIADKEENFLERMLIGFVQRKNSFVGILAGMAVCFAVYSIWNGRQQAAHRDRFMGSLQERVEAMLYPELEDSLDRLAHYASKETYLQPSVDSVLAQGFLFVDSPEKALQYYDRMDRRTLVNHDPIYKELNTIAFLSAQEDWQAALASSRRLANMLIALEQEEGSQKIRKDAELLRTYNLIEQSHIMEKLGDYAGAYTMAMLAIELFDKDNQYIHDFTKAFTLPGASLKNYLLDRQARLKKAL